MDALDRADLPFPHSLPEFQRLFPDDAAAPPTWRKPDYTVSYPVLAGADILAARSPEAFLAIPEANLKAALAYHLVVSIGGESRIWDKEIMAAHPVLAREVLG